MEPQTEPMSNEDLSFMYDRLENSSSILTKIGLWLFGISAVVLFVPMEILNLFTKRGRKRDISGILFEDLGLINTLLYIVLPICLILVLIYFIGVHKIKKDIKGERKLVGLVKVLKIEELDKQTKKDLLGLADHIIKFEKNPYKIDETHFLKDKEPELFNAKLYRVEVAEISKIELKREIVSNIA